MVEELAASDGTAIAASTAATLRRMMVFLNRTLITLFKSLAKSSLSCLMVMHRTLYRLYDATD